MEESGRGLGTEKAAEEKKFLEKKTHKVEPIKNIYIYNYLFIYLTQFSGFLSFLSSIDIMIKLVIWADIAFLGI